MEGVTTAGGIDMVVLKVFVSAANPHAIGRSSKWKWGRSGSSMPFW